MVVVSKGAFICSSWAFILISALNSAKRITGSFCGKLWRALKHWSMVGLLDGIVLACLLSTEDGCFLLGGWVEVEVRNLWKFWSGKNAYLPQTQARWYAWMAHGSGSAWNLWRVLGLNAGGCLPLRDYCLSVVCLGPWAVRRSQGCVWAGPCWHFWLWTIFGKAWCSIGENTVILSKIKYW